MVIQRRPAIRSRPPRFASSGARLPIRGPHGTTRSRGAGIRRAMPGLLLAALLLGVASSFAHDRWWAHRHDNPFCFRFLSSDRCSTFPGVEWRFPNPFRADFAFEERRGGQDWGSRGFVYG